MTTRRAPNSHHRGCREECLNTAPVASRTARNDTSNPCAPTSARNFQPFSPKRLLGTRVAVLGRASSEISRMCKISRIYRVLRCACREACCKKRATDLLGVALRLSWRTATSSCLLTCSFRALCGRMAACSCQLLENARPPGAAEAESKTWIHQSISMEMMPRRATACQWMTQRVTPRNRASYAA